MALNFEEVGGVKHPSVCSSSQPLLQGGQEYLKFAMYSMKNFVKNFKER